MAFQFNENANNIDDARRDICRCMVILLEWLQAMVRTFAIVVKCLVLPPPSPSSGKL